MGPKFKKFSRKREPKKRNKRERGVAKRRGMSLGRKAKVRPESGPLRQGLGVSTGASVLPLRGDFVGAAVNFEYSG